MGCNPTNQSQNIVGGNHSTTAVIMKRLKSWREIVTSLNLINKIDRSFIQLPWRTEHIAVYASTFKLRAWPNSGNTRPSLDLSTQRWRKASNLTPPTF